MKLEVGKYYRTRDGRKVGPMRDTGCCGDDVFHAKTGSCAYKRYYENGVERHGEDGSRDLIAEWTADPEVGPVRTVTTTRVIPGEYGCVKVHDPGSEYVRINIDAAMDVTALTDAIVTLTAIRDAMMSPEE